jgi:hypothetical protein
MAGGAMLAATLSYRRAMAQARNAYARTAAPAAPPLGRFDPRQVQHLPETAQRYLVHAIAPGTALYSVAELEMTGTFLLGDKAQVQSYAMDALQALRPPDQFVWIPRLRSGVMTISGSDALVGGEAWTRFWLAGLVPVAQEPSSPDLVRSAQFRAAVEGALWLPTSLLPGRGVEWVQTGPDEARAIIRGVDPAIVFDLKLDKSGSVLEVVGQRWSNANPERTFRMQPFGGTVSQERCFQGLTIPSAIAVGNLFGTADYLPFFQARLTRAAFH